MEGIVVAGELLDMTYPNPISVGLVKGLVVLGEFALLAMVVVVVLIVLCWLLDNKPSRAKWPCDLAFNPWPAP